jgi:hypothetical protein
LINPVQPGHVVEVPMAEHDRLERVGRDAQPVEVLDQTERADAGVIQDTMHPPTLVHIDQCRVAVLGAQEIQGRPADRHAAERDRQWPAGTRQPPTAHRPHVGQQHVGGVVHQGGHVDPIDRLKSKKRHRRPLHKSRRD